MTSKCRSDGEPTRARCDAPLEPPPPTRSSGRQATTATDDDDVDISVDDAFDTVDPVALYHLRRECDTSCGGRSTVFEDSSRKLHASPPHTHPQLQRYMYKSRNNKQFSKLSFAYMLFTYSSSVAALPAKVNYIAIVTERLDSRADKHPYT